jgi:uncharacterized protein (DUF58 family)
MSWFWRQIYRQYRLFSWAQYAAGRRLTPAGGVVLGCLVLTLLLGVNRETMVSYQAITLLLFLTLSAPVAAIFFRVNLSLKRTLPRFGTVGQTTTYAVTLKNLTAKTQAGLVLFEDLTDPRPSFAEWLALKQAEQQTMRPFWLSGRPRSVPAIVARVRAAPLPSLPPGREVEVTVELTPLRRGVLSLAGFTVARSDPFGLFRALKRFAHPGKMLILPRRYPLPSLSMPGSLKYQEGGVALAANVGQSDEFVALRDYRRGDPLRHIHWRSWARTGKPIVKEFEDEFFVRHALVLDTFVRRPNAELFEEAVSVAASFACAIQTQESLLDLLFVGAEAYCFTAGRGLAHADQMLEILAAVQPSPRAPTPEVNQLEQFLTRMVTGRGGVKTFADLEHLVLNHSAVVSNCICILLDWDEPRRQLVQKLKTSGVPVWVVVLVAEAPKTPLDAGPLRDEPQCFHTLVLGEIETGLQRL